MYKQSKVITLFFVLLMFITATSHAMNNTATRLTYTAFDGDNLLHIDSIRLRMLKAGKLALNPEHTLGYYVSTHSHHGKKFEVMRDCLALVEASDQFSIFVDGSYEKLPLSELSEGILIEILYYLRRKQTATTIYWELLDNCHKDCDFPLKEITLDVSSFKLILGTRFSSVDKALNKLIDKPLPELVHIIISDKNIKYADWIRVKAYERGLVPIIPQLIMPKLVYVDNAMLGSYISDYSLIQAIGKHKWFIVSNINEKNEFNNYFSKKGYSLKDIREFEVPKYVNPTNWSLTPEESKEIIEKTPG